VGQALNTFEERIRAARLTPAQRQVARLLLEDSERLVHLSAAEVASEAGVSQPSVSRLAKSLGYASYGSMMTAVRERAARTHGAPDAEAGNRFQVAVEDEITLLQTLKARLGNEAGLKSAAARIGAASEVVVLGLRISASLALNLAYRLGRMRPGIAVITNEGSQAYDDLALHGQSHSPTLVIFAMPRYPTAVLELATFARRRGFQIILITDSSAAALSLSADEVLVAEINWGLTFGTHTAAFVLSALLAEEAGALASEQMRRRLGDLDEVAAERGHYLTD
jgi:DNA-binding MurR/RpiR family transcriptional regulator